MNSGEIGRYIQYLRKQKSFSQKELAERLGVSFQAVSKWETGENLPDVSILLDLADILDTTTDKILNGGNIIVRRNKKVNIEDIKEGFAALEDLKIFFGEKSPLYRGAIEGINTKMNVDIEEYLKHSEGREALLAEAVIQYLMNGYDVSEADVEAHFKSADLRRSVKKYMSSCSLFQSKAQSYVNYRPAYPSAVVDLVCSLTPTPIVADIGSGTGKFSALCVDRVKRLYAVEPNAQMRQAAEELLSGKVNYNAIAAVAEQTTLEDASVDIIIAAESYHWFDNDATKAEFRRILRPGGYVFLLWNRFGGDPFDDEKEQIRTIYRQKRGVQASGLSYEERAENLFGKGGFQKIEFDNSILQSRDEFCGGMASTSYAPEKGSEDYEKFQKKTRAVFDKYASNGILKTTVATVCFWGQLQ